MRILFVCTANLDRSPAAELVLRELRPHVHETRSAGTSPAARRQIGGDDLDWADVVVVMEDHHREAIARRWPGRATTARVLGIPDRYQRDDAALRSLLEVRLRELLAALEVV